MGRSLRVVLFAAGLLAGSSGVADAQVLEAIEVVPFGGYRFGGGFYELVSGEEVDLDGAVSYGLVVDLPFRGDLQVEALVTHQEARFTLPAGLDAGRRRWRVTVDHYQLGGLRELNAGGVRPFLTGMLGLTRYAAEGDNEVRFSIAGGGGVKLYPSARLGVRLDGRIFATLVDAEGDALACTPGFCVGSIDAHVVWQAAFTAGLIVRF